MSEQTRDPEQPIAIVGMAARLPGAPDVDSFWRVLVERVDAIRPVPPERWDASAQLDPEKSVQAVGGFLEGVDRFDPTFFGISPREAEDIDPQQRLVMQAGWRALEDAGTPAAALRGSRTGVYVGASWHDYEILRKDRGEGATQHSLVGNALDVIAARLSYFLKLRGPSLTVETGCSSSLVALHLAGQALRRGEIDGAVVAGVNLIMSPDVSVGLTHFGGLSKAGRCHAFGAAADGFVRGEGVIALYLKTVEQAVQDGDRIHAVIARTAVNNDGGGDSLVTPNPDGQIDLLRQAYGDGTVPLDKLSYIEAHGTGTLRGDPVEARGIGTVLGQARDRALGPLGVGSAKTNVGHLEAAAGMAGLVKAVLSLKHRLVPPSLHSEELNPDIPFEELNLRVVREPLELPAEGELYMGVNSFGWGGTNAHVVLRSAPPVEPAADEDDGAPVLLPLTAQHPEALRALAAELAGALPADRAGLLAAADTLGTRRDAFPLRAAVVGADAQELAEGLRGYAGNPEAELPGVVTGRARTRGRTAFVFPGQGSQWAGMGRELYGHDPVFTATVDRCGEALRPWFAWDLAALVSGAAGDEWTTRIDMLQPVLWAMSLGLAERWRACGVTPDVVVGHSQGEVTAATFAGILSYEDGAKVMARRSAIARRTSGNGRMLAVDLDVPGAHRALEGFEEQVSLAVNNGPSSCVLSGYTDAVLMLKEILEAEGTFCRLVNVDYASHSPQMDELREDLLAALADVAPRAGEIGLMSTVRVEPLTGPEMDTAYWVDNLRRPVLFADAMGRLFDEGVTHVVEISPHPILAPAVEQLAALRAEPPAVLSTLRREQGSRTDLQLALARGFVAGLEPFVRRSAGEFAAVPGYPWQEESYWGAPGRARTGGQRGLEVELTPGAFEQDSWQGALEISTADLPWLADHKVDEAVVLPGAAMAALALSTAYARTGAVPGTVASLAFHRDLTLGADETARLAVLWRDDITEGGSFTLLSLPAGTTGWTEHATARLHQRRADQVAAPAFPAALAEDEPLPAEDFYAACAARGLHYGPSFQGLDGVHVADDAALGRVRLPERCRAGARPHTLHPALLDAALQVSLTLEDDGHTVVPVSVDAIHLLQDLAEPVVEVWSYAVRRETGLVDLHLYDAERQPLAVLAGLRLQRLESGPAEVSDAERLHRLRFRPQERAADTEAGEGPWLVVTAADDPAADRLAEALGAGAVLGAADRDEAALTAALRAVAPAELVFAAPATAAGLPAQRAGLLALTALVRAATALATPPRLTVLTQDAQAVAPGDHPDPGAALYWGFTRVLRREHPELRPALLDVAAGQLAAAAAELGFDEGEDQAALRDGVRYVGRLVRGEDEDEDRAAPAWRTPEQPFRLVPEKPGFWDGLAFKPLTRRAPAPGHVEVRVGAAALNFIDVMKAMGTYPDSSAGADLLGGECAGTVTAVGEGVTGVAVGDRVVACVFGSIASYVTVRAEHTRPVPAHLTDAAAAALPLVLATAWYALDGLAGLEQGESVLIHSATGGLGLAAVRIARARGARVIATAGSASKRAYLRGLGIADVFDSRDLEWASQTLAATGGRGVDVVLNSLTGAAIPLGLEVLAEDGRFIEVGKKDIYAERSISLGAFRKGITVAAVDLAGLMDRRPARFAKLFAEVWDLVAAEEIEELPVNAYPFTEAAEALREMSRGSHIGKFVLRDPATVTAVAPEPLPGGRFRADGTYLLSGGLGALGLSLAEHLAANGAGALALLGRSAPSEDAEKRIAALREHGTLVEVVAADVADATSLYVALARVRAELPPLRGVFHAAGLLDDATVLNLRPEQLERVLAPKVDGARNLDAATDGDPLDLFVLFSSAAALIGNAGQAAYAAGNAYLDTLAEQRRRRGLPALSVQWGPFEEIGLAAQDANRGARLAERGMGGFTADEAWAALGRLLERGGEQVVGYVPLNLRQWFDAYPDTAALRSWQVLREASRQGGNATGGGEFRSALLAAAEDERPALAEQKVRELAGRVLRLDPAAIDRETPFKALGLDSLMGLELRNRLEAAFGLKLSPTLLWTYGSSRALAEVLCDRLAEEPATTA
ncbi:SDR family NAD(P)-dependent oxidoreductase [Kitasatospora sp. NPDC048365]|uniref:SDR family NAD(P)-dependent oxidoreductase n=1 Tax=Kitasatospora sp. NPDC048365 TaxID=3364050 RepID=UPI003710A036